MKQFTSFLLLFSLISSCQTKKYHEDRVAVDLTAVPETLHSVYQWQKNKKGIYNSPKNNTTHIKAQRTKSNKIN